MVINPSPRFALLLILLHAAAGFAVSVAMMPTMVKLPLFLLVLLSLFHSLARDALVRLPGAWRTVLPQHEQVSVTSRNGSGFTGKVLEGTAIYPGFVVLRILPEKCRLPVSRVIFPDALATGMYRDLCVRLKHDWNLLQ